MTNSEDKKRRAAIHNAKYERKLIAQSLPPVEEKPLSRKTQRKLSIIAPLLIGATLGLMGKKYEQ